MDTQAQGQPADTPPAPDTGAAGDASPPLIVVGWRERLNLPAWKIRGIRAKLDTGARTSAIDVDHIEELPGDRVRFEVIVRETPTRESAWLEAPVARWSVVKPSSGELQRRPVVRTPMRLAGVEHEIEIGLVARRGMLCRMLLGRTALAGVFAVDPARKYIVSPAKRKRRPGGPSSTESSTA